MFFFIANHTEIKRCVQSEITDARFRIPGKQVKVCKIGPL